MRADTSIGVDTDAESYVGTVLPWVIVSLRARPSLYAKARRARAQGAPRRSEWRRSVVRAPTVGGRAGNHLVRSNVPTRASEPRSTRARRQPRVSFERPTCAFSCRSLRCASCGSELGSHVGRTDLVPRGPDRASPTWAGQSGSHVGRTERVPRGPDKASPTWAGQSGSHVGRTERVPRGPDRTMRLA